MNQITSRLIGVGLVVVALGWSGCESTGGDSESSSAGFPSEIGGSIQWLGANVAAWPATATLRASVSSTTITLDYDKANVWRAVSGVNANPWVFVKWSDGNWYAATWEYLRRGQTSKPMCVLGKCGGHGDHIKQPPLSSWRPRSGERIGLMVSGLARGQLRNHQERSNVVMVTWP